MTCGIYVIKNLITNQLYIGQSVKKVYIGRSYYENVN